jgi:hypothetical protein
VNRIFYLSPDDTRPVGGIKILYRHVDILNRHGFEAAIVHRKKGFRCTWFENETRVLYYNKIEPDSGDVVVVPEIYGPRATDHFPEAGKVIFNQNAHLTFWDYDVHAQNPVTAYHDPAVRCVMVVSEDSRRYLERVFPRVPVRRVHVSTTVDAFPFRPLSAKQKVITYMPRKNPEDARQVISILTFLGLLDGWDVKPIAGLPYQEVAELIGRSSLFLSFGHPEGCPMPPIEAMLSGAIVVGYHGNGGREFFHPEYSWPVDAGDIMGFVDAAQEVLRLFRTDLPGLQQRAAKARAFVEVEYSPAREERDVLELWRELLPAAVRRPELAAQSF